MIRRFYVLPLKADVSEAKLDEFLRALSDSDRFIPGLLNSSAGVDFDSRTVLWENTFVDEETYSGPYMVHPYHIATLDNYVMADSPECVTQDIYTTRYQLPGAIPHIERGIRRVVMMNLAEAAEASTIETLAAHSEGIATTVFRPDDVGWVSGKGRPWTHLWEQGFIDRAALDHYLNTREGIACSSLEGFKRLGVRVESLKILTCSFELKPAHAQSPVDVALEPSTTLYTITAHTAIDDVDAYVELLERYYDPYVVGGGGTLVHRWRTVDHAYGGAEVQSTWRLDSVAAYTDMRAKTGSDPGWNVFVRDAMPLVKGGSRRFYRILSLSSP
jgi:hypothetical protein